MVEGCTGEAVWVTGALKSPKLGLDNGYDWPLKLWSCAFRAAFFVESSAIGHCHIDARGNFDLSQLRHNSVER
jgi:hypothetical protein